MKIAHTDDQSCSLFHEGYQELYHCWGGALAKANHIFLAPVLETLPGVSSSPFRILEVGFGAGLNTFVTMDAFLKKTRPLHYTALENDLLPADTLAGLQYENYLNNKEILPTFLAARETLEDGSSALDVTFGAQTELSIRIGNALTTPLPKAGFDWVYHDPFSPRATPELWSAEFLQRIHDSMRDGAGFCTYCVKGDIRRLMQDIGFTVTKRPGIQRKREVMLAWK